MKPLAVDLCCGLGGWTHGLLAEGWDVVGFDVERHQYGGDAYPAQLVLQDILTLDGRQFRGKVSLLVASPPCTEFSYMAMPWRRAKQIARAFRGLDDFPDGYTGSQTTADLTRLFDACVRIGREADCPIVIENVRGAQPWIGRAKWMFGSFALWGDVPALMPMTKPRANVPTMGAGWYPPDHPKHVPGLAFNGHADRNLRATKNDGGSSWFAVAHNKSAEQNDPRDGVKQRGSGREWFAGDGKISRMTSSKSNARKAASAQIAKIPLPLARWIARAWYPLDAAERLKATR